MTQPTTQPRTRPLPISPGEITANRDALTALMQEPPVPPEPKMTTVLAVIELAPQIREALRAGYPLAEIAKRLRFGGRTLSAQQLQRYLSRCEKRLAKKAPSRKAVPPTADAAAPRPTPQASPSAATQGATGSVIRHTPTVQAPTVVRSTPTATLATPTTPSVSGTRTGSTAGSTMSSQDRQTAAANAAVDATTTTAKPQSAASPELPGLSFHAARSLSIGRMLGTARSEANLDQPRQSNIVWELAGQSEHSSVDGAQTEPPPASTTRP